MTNSSSNWPLITVDPFNNVFILYTKWEDQNNSNPFYLVKLNKYDNNITNLKKINVDYSPKEYIITSDSMGNNYIFWTYWNHNKRGLHLMKLNNNGEVLINKNISSFNNSSVFGPVMNIDFSDNIHLIWIEYNNGSCQYYICYMKLDNKGNILVNSKRISNTTSTMPDKPSISFNSVNTAYIIWSNSYNLSLKCIDNFGNILLNKTKIITRQYHPWSPKVVIDSEDNLNIIWIETYNVSSNYYKIYYTKSDKKGTNLIDTKVLIPKVGFPIKYMVAIDTRDQMHLVIDGFGIELNNNTSTTRSLIPLAIQIYYVKFDVNGNILNTPIYLNKSNRESASSIAVDSIGNVYVAWWGHYSEIYYRYKLVNLPSGEGKISGFIKDIYGNLLKGAKAWIWENDVYITDDNSYYEINVQSGQSYRVTVEADGYYKCIKESGQIGNDCNISLYFELEPYKNNTDYDRDGYNNSLELSEGSDQNISSSTPKDMDKIFIPDSIDSNNDNDGLTDSDEILIGSNQLLYDTDNDSYNDSIDEYPLDPTKWVKESGNGLSNGEEPEDKKNMKDNTMPFVGISIIIIIVVLILLFIFLKKKTTQITIMKNGAKDQNTTNNKRK